MDRRLVGQDKDLVFKLRASRDYCKPLRSEAIGPHLCSRKIGERMEATLEHGERSVGALRSLLH